MSLGVVLMDHCVKSKIRYEVIKFKRQIESFVFTGNFSFVKLAKKEGQSWRFNRKHGCSKSAVGRVVSTLRTCWLLQRVSVTTSTTRRGASQLSESCKGEWAREVKWMWFLSLNFCFEFMLFCTSFHWWLGASSKILGRHDCHATRSVLFSKIQLRLQSCQYYLQCYPDNYQAYLCMYKVNLFFNNKYQLCWLLDANLIDWKEKKNRERVCLKHYV